MNIREFVNEFKKNEDRSLDWIRKNASMEVIDDVHKRNDEHTKKVWEFVKQISPIFLGITSDYVLDNYRMEFHKDSIFFRWNTPVAPNDPTPRSHFAITVEDGKCTVSIGWKKWDDALVTDSPVVVVAFLNVYEDYLIEQKMFGYEN